METKKISDDQIKALKTPLPHEAIKQHPTKAYLSTIKAIYVVERFNQVFGIGGWFINNEVVEAKEKNIVVKSTFHAPEYGIVIPDIFGGNDNADRGDAYKGACTDALTKIGSYLYVGMDVYKGKGDNPDREPQEVTGSVIGATGTIKEQATTQRPTEDTRAWLTEKQYNEAVKRINEGDITVYPKILINLRMKKQYKEELQNLHALSLTLKKE